MSEILAIPEEHLQEFIDLVRYSIVHFKPSKEVRKALVEWCEDEEEYLARLNAD